MGVKESGASSIAMTEIQVLCWGRLSAEFHNVRLPDRSLACWTMSASSSRLVKVDAWV